MTSFQRRLQIDLVDRKPLRLLHELIRRFQSVAVCLDEILIEPSADAEDAQQEEHAHGLGVFFQTSDEHLFRDEADLVKVANECVDTVNYNIHLG